MHTTPAPRPSVLRRRLALLVAPALALVIAVGCGSDDPATGETAVLGAEVERTPTAGSPPRRIVAESTDRAAPGAPSDAVRIGGVRIAAESTDRVPAGGGDVASRVAGERYAGQAEAQASPGHVAESTDRVRPSDETPSLDALVGSRYAGQAEAYASQD